VEHEVSIHERRSIPIHKKHINIDKLLGFVVGMRNPKIGSDCRFRQLVEARSMSFLVVCLVIVLQLKGQGAGLVGGRRLCRLLRGIEYG